MALGDIFQLVRIVQINGQEHVNVLHFQDADGTFEDEEETLAEAWDEDMSDCPELELRQFQTGAVSFVPVSLSVQRISPTKGEAVIRGLHPRTISIAAGLPTINQIAMNITTARNDRSGRGRMYIGGIRDVHTDGNLLNAAGIPVFESFMDAVADRFSAGGSSYSGFVLGVWSRKLEEFNAATVLQGSVVIGSMVSRRPGRGN